MTILISTTIFLDLRSILTTMINNWCYQAGFGGEEIVLISYRLKIEERK